MKRTIEGYTWKEWNKHLCTSWSGSSDKSCRKWHLPEVFTSLKHMGLHKDKGVKIRMTVEELEGE